MSKAEDKTRTDSQISVAFVENRGMIRRFLARFLSGEHDIEDMTQQAYLKAYAHEREKGEVSQPKAFLFKVAKNLAINELKL